MTVLNRPRRAWLYRHRKAILWGYVIAVVTLGTILQALQSAGIWP